jgi:hypothetical protein
MTNNASASNLLNSALAISSFSGSRRRDFAKNWGVAAGVDVMLNPMSGCGLHIPGSQNGGVLLKQDFDICRH